MLNKLIFILSVLVFGSATVWIDHIFSADISFEWSPDGYDGCSDCTFDLWKNENIIVPDIPKTQTTITVPLLQEKVEDDYMLTAKDRVQRSAFSRVVRVGDNNYPIITGITQIK